MVRPISFQLQAQAIKEINEVPKRIPEDIITVREWLKKQHHLKAYDDDQTLLNFLRCCKFSLQNTKNKLDSLYTTKTIVPELFNNRDPLSAEIQRVLEAGLIYVLPKLEDNGPRIIIWNMAKCNPDTMSYITLIKISCMFIDVLLMEDDHSIISGVLFWADLKDCPVKYATQFTPTNLKKHMHIIEKALPLRIKGLHFTNCPSVIEYVYHVMKSLSLSKLMQRMSLYNNIESFYSIVPQRLMPKEYGGDNDSMENLKGVWKEKLENRREWFLRDSEYKSNEPLRPGGPKTISDIFGIKGSFRKLTID
ncbi:hypothetical protein FQR65_LT14896 [Abscondita terminalis]|nr:hypothetical protein FQR65_LT14896 [Abscondita terminalis]